QAPLVEAGELARQGHEAARVADRLAPLVLQHLGELGPERAALGGGAQLVEGLGARAEVVRAPAPAETVAGVAELVLDGAGDGAVDELALAPLALLGQALEGRDVTGVLAERGVERGRRLQRAGVLRVG